MESGITPGAVSSSTSSTAVREGWFFCTISIASMSPPASPIAVATRPNDPGTSGSSTRSRYGIGRSASLQVVVVTDANSAWLDHHAVHSEVALLIHQTIAPERLHHVFRAQPGSGIDVHDCTAVNR